MPLNKLATRGFGSDNVEYKDHSCMDCDAMWCGRWVPMFWRSLCDIVFQETTIFSLAVHQCPSVCSAVSGCNNMRTINSVEKNSNSRTQTR
jgi:hypothetical protein